MNPVCEACQGACCESVTIAIPEDPPADYVRWISYRGKISNRRIHLEAQCSMLTNQGKCAIWDTRPQPCKDYVVGGMACLDAIHRRRAEDETMLHAMLEEWAG